MVDFEEECYQYTSQAESIAKSKHWDRSDRAKVCFARALQKTNQDHHHTYNHWGKNLLAEFRYQEAIAKFNLSIQIEPTYPYTYFYWGLALVRLGKYDEAIPKCQKALQLDPKCFLFYQEWTLAVYLLGDEKEAEKIYQTGLKATAPRDNWTPLTLYITYHREYDDHQCRYRKIKDQEVEVKLWKELTKGIKWLYQIQYNTKSSE